MARFGFNRFAGSVPRLADHLVGETAAAEAIDCKFHDGTLQSWREPKLVQALDPATTTVYAYKCCYLEFAGCVDVAEGPVTCDRLYTTGDQPWPAVMTLEGEDCTPTIRRLGLPCPDTAPSVVPGSLAGTHEKDSEGRSYAYQFVNSFGERSALSRASAPQMIRDGQPVVVTGWALPPSGDQWDIAALRIYRTVTGHQSGLEDVNVLDTVWMLVAEIDPTDVSYTDTIYNENLDTALEEDVVLPPPADLQGITMIKSMNTLAGFSGRRLYFSVNNSYHNWRDFLTLDHVICGIAESNGMIYVATEGNPYVVVGKTDCQEGACREAIMYGERLPMAGCGNKRITPTVFGAVYPTHEGMVALSGNNNPEIITAPLYSEDDWFQLVPQSLIPVAHDGYLFAFGAVRSFVMKLPTTLAKGWEYDLHSNLSDTDVRDAFVTSNGDLMLVKPGELVEWNRGLTLRPHLWRSSELVTTPPLPMAGGVIHCSMGVERVQLRVDRYDVIDQNVVGNTVMTLPRWAKGETWQITLSGTARVSLIQFTNTMKEFR